jgi:hypothetical protein
MRRLYLVAFASVFAICLYRAFALPLVLGQSGPPRYTGTVYASYQFNVLKHPTGLEYLALYTTPTLYIADTGNNLIRSFNVSAGTLQTAAGTGTPGYADGPVGSAQFNSPTGLKGFYHRRGSCGGRGNQDCYSWVDLYVSDTKNYVIRRLCLNAPPVFNHPSYAEPCPAVSTLAGNGTQGYVDTNTASSQFSHASGIGGSWYVADATNNVIRQITPDTNGVTGVSVTTFAGTGVAGLSDGYRTNVQFNRPTQVAWDSNSNMYVTDAANHVIRKIDTSGNVTTLAGSGTPGFADGTGSAAKFNKPCTIVYNYADGFFYVADCSNNAIRRVSLSGVVTTYAGTPPQGGLVNGSLLQSKFQCPMGIVIRGGFMYIADAMNNVIRRIDMSAGIVSTYIS